MISKWRNSYAEAAAEMLQVTDKTILDWSNGEVNTISEEEILPHSLEDPAIFGKIESLAMGHITLPKPIINVQYLCGRRPVLAGIIGMTQSETEQITHYIKYINVNKNSTNYKKLIDYKSYCQLENREDYKTGAEAIELLLGKGLKENIILHNIPVIPLCMRYVENEDSLQPMYINYMYERIINRINRLNKLIDLTAPEIILINESRMLQEYVDQLINNGAYGIPVMMRNGCPAESLSELYEYITKDIKRINYKTPDNYEADAAINALIIKYQNYENECEKNENIDLKEEEETKDKMMEYIITKLSPFLHAMVETYFKGYNEKPFLAVARYSIENVILELDCQRNIEDQICKGIGKTFENFAKKRVKFLKGE